MASLHMSASWGTQTIGNWHGDKYRWLSLTKTKEARNFFFGTDLVIFNGEFGSLGSEQEGFSLLEFSLFKAELGLVDQNLKHALWIMALSHTLRTGPVLVVDVPGARTQKQSKRKIIITSLFCYLDMWIWAQSRGQLEESKTIKNPSGCNPIFPFIFQNSL